MLLAVVFVVTLSALVVPFLLMNRPSNDDAQLQARFASIRAKGAGGLVLTDEDNLLKAIAPEATNWIEKLLLRMALAQKFQPLFTQANSKTTVRKLLLTCLATGCAAGFLVLIFVPMRIAGLAAGVGGSYLPIMLLQFRKNRRVAAFNKVLPDAVEMMSRSLRAGYSLIAAISIVAESAPEPARSEFSEVFRKQNFGLPLRDALMQLIDRVPSPDLRVLVTGILVQKDTGGNLAEILDRIVAVIRERQKIQGEIRTHTAQGRMTGWVLCALPPLMLFVINFINPGYSKALTEDPTGRKMLYVGIVLLVIGALTIRHIVKAVEV